MYEKDLLNSLNSLNKIFPKIMVYFISLVLIAGISKNVQRNKYLHHLCFDGICQNYTTWMWHWEVDKNWKATSKMHEFDEDMDDQLEDMIHDIGESSFY